MRYEVVVLGHHEFVQAFALGEIRGREVSSREEALEAWRLFSKQEGIGVILLPFWVERDLFEEIQEKRLSRSFPLVLALPHPLKDEEGKSMSALFEYVRRMVGLDPQR